MKKAVLIPICFILLSLVLVSQSYADTWDDTRFTHRQLINVTNLNAVGLNEYQLNFSYADLNVSALSVAGKVDMKTVSFGDGNGNIYGHCNNCTERNVVWVNISNLSASTTFTMYMYYKNNTAVTTQDSPWNVFPVYDDFQAGSLNTTSWEEVRSGTTTISYGGGVQIRTGTTIGSYGGLLSVKNVTRPIRTEANVTLFTTNDWGAITFYGRNVSASDASIKGYWFGLNTGTTLFLRNNSIAGADLVASKAVTITAPVLWSMVINSTGVMGLLNNTYQMVSSDAGQHNSNRTGIQAQTGTTTTNGADYNLYRVRRYAFIDANYSAGAEQTLAVNGTTIIVFNAGNTTDITTTWNVLFTNGTHTNSFFNQVNNATFIFSSIPTGINNITIFKTGFANKTFSGYGNNESFANTSRLGIWKNQYFYAQQNGTTTPILTFQLQLILGATTLSSSTTTGEIAISLENLTSLYGSATAKFLSAGFNDTYVPITLDGNAALNVTANMSATTVLIRAFDEQTFAALRFNATITNGTTTNTYTNVSNVSGSYTAFPSGSLTITITETTGLYVQRTYYATLTSTNGIGLDAYLLRTANGNIVTYGVQSQEGAAIQGAIVTLQTIVNGQLVTVAQATTDATGRASVFQNPLTTYTVIVQATGYPTFSTSITSGAETFFQFTLGSGSQINFQTCITGVDYAFMPISNRLNRSQTSNINFTAFSAYGDLEYFGLNITLNTTVLSFTNTTTITGGTIIATFNTSSFTLGEIINATGFVKRQGYVQCSATKSYILSNTNYNATTLAGARDELNSNATGLSPFAKGLLGILIVVAILGVTAYAPLAGGVIGLGILSFTVITYFGLFPRWALFLLYALCIGYALSKN